MAKYPEVNIDRRIRRGMYLDAWSVANSIHDLYTILKKFPGKLEAPETTQFIEETEVATVPRNGVDHLPGNLCPT
jgi:hypothetical protein